MVPRFVHLTLTVTGMLLASLLWTVAAAQTADTTDTVDTADTTDTVDTTDTTDTVDTTDTTDTVDTTDTTDTVDTTDTTDSVDTADTTDTVDTADTTLGAGNGYGKVGYAHITGVIDRMRHRYLDRVIDDANELDLDTLIMHIDTDGGEVLHAREMFKRVLDQKREGMRMIAFVDFRAISAGAMITYAHEEIYISETASIGDIGVIFISREGEMKYAPEKVETVIRTLLVQAAEQRGWNRALLLKMTARNQTLYRVHHEDGSQSYVIEDDLPDFLVQHPEIDKEDDRQLVVYRGEDRLLTLTGREAIELGMATGVAEDVDSLYEKLAIEPSSVVDLSPKPFEITAWALATFAPLLAGIAFLLIMFELKTPGVGWFAVIGALCGALFLISQYYLDMAENLEVVLLVAGVALLAVEMFTMIGGGFIGLAGGLLAFTGLIMLFLPNELEFDFTDSRFLDALGDAAANSLLSVGVAALGLVGFIALAPRSRWHQTLTMRSEVGATSAGKIESQADTMVGRTVTVREMLRPSGTLEVDGTDYSARAEHGAFVAAGVEVEIVEVRLGELVVRALVNEPGESAIE